MIIIVARYREDISWTKHFPKVLIYNKGDKLNCPNEIMLTNVGREGHTYYKYIYDNYDKLEDYTVFLQGNPYDHSPNIISNLTKYIRNSKLDTDFEFLSERIFNCTLLWCKYHGRPLPLSSVYEQLFNKKDFNKELVFGAGAQFLVSKKQILRHSREFYLKIVNLLGYEKNPIEGYVIERFHKTIFAPQKRINLVERPWQKQATIISNPSKPIKRAILAKTLSAIPLTTGNPFSRGYRHLNLDGK